MKTKPVLSICMALAAGGLMAKDPYDYSEDVSTPEKRAAVIARLWAHDPKLETPLWPAGRMPLARGETGPVTFDEKTVGDGILRVTRVSEPFFRFQRAPGPGVKPVVVVLPGGGYGILAWNHEGLEVADWLNSLGFSAAVLAYRVPDQRDGALCDVQRAIGLLRRDAAAYGIDPKRVGVMGFSAGANLAIRASTNARKRFYARIDTADDVSCRPDFQLPIYPWDIRTRKDPTTPWKGWSDLRIRPEYPIDAETPPSFTVQSTDDFCEAETAMTYDCHLRRAGVDSEIRLYHEGGHGYGIRRHGKATDVWPYEAARWLMRFGGF